MQLLSSNTSNTSNTSRPVSAHSFATRGLQTNSGFWSANQQKVLPPVHFLVQESKVQAGAGVGQAHLEHQVVGVVQAGYGPLLDVTPVFGF